MAFKREFCSELAGLDELPGTKEEIVSGDKLRVCACVCVGGGGAGSAHARAHVCTFP